MKKFSNYIGGKWVAPESGEYFENHNPADRDDVVGKFPLSDRRDVDRRGHVRRRFHLTPADPKDVAVALASAFDHSGRRRVPGAREIMAEIVAVPGDPVEDIRLTEKVVFVMKDGKVVRNGGH